MSSMDGGKGDGGLAFWMLEVGWRGRGRGGERKAAFIEHWSGCWKCILHSCAVRVASCFMTWLDVVLSLAHTLESFNPGLKNVEPKDFDVCVCVCVCNAILHIKLTGQLETWHSKMAFQPGAECLRCFSVRLVFWSAILWGRSLSPIIPLSVPHRTVPYSTIKIRETCYSISVSPG